MVYTTKHQPDYEILYEDDLLLALNKKAGLLSVATDNKTNAKDLLMLLRRDLDSKVYLLGRLDRDTSGLLLATRKQSFAQVFLKNNLNQELKKTYLALVHGKVSGSSGTINTPLPARNSQKKIPARTSYQVLGKSPEASLLAVQIHTGRHHQIRLHLAGLGHPVIGDRLEGNFALNKSFVQKRGYNKLWLHSWRLKFQHFTSKKELELEAPVPPDKLEVLHALGLGKVV